jgi:type I restriction enzyme S subunit
VDKRSASTEAVDIPGAEAMSTELRPGYKQTEVGVIPCDWCVRQIIDVCGFIVPGRNKPNFLGGTIPWITTPDLVDGGSVFESRIGLVVSKEQAEKVGSRVVPPGSVVMSCVGELGIVAYAEREIVINQQLHAFVPTDQIDAHFLLHAIKTRKPYLESIATKTALPYLNKANCKSIHLPFPPLCEQRAIAAALSDVDALLAKLDALIAKKRDLKQAAMQQLLTGHTRLPGFSSVWELQPFESLFSIRGGLSASRDQLSDSGYCYLHYGDIHKSSRTFIDVEKKFLELPKLDVRLSTVSPSCLLKDGDVVFVDASEDDVGTSKHLVVANRGNLPPISPDCTRSLREARMTG